MSIGAETEPQIGVQKGPLVLLAMEKVCKISLIGEIGHPNGFEITFVRTPEYQGSKAIE